MPTATSVINWAEYYALYSSKYSDNLINVWKVSYHLAAQTYKTNWYFRLKIQGGGGQYPIE